MRIVILAPIKNSLYARLVTHLLVREPGIDVRRIVIRTPWNMKRLRGELRRDGARLLRKAYRKLVLGEAAYKRTNDEDSIATLATKLQLPGKDLHELGRQHGVAVSTVSDHNARDSCRGIQDEEPDLIVFTGGGLIRSGILDIPKLGTLNCHMGPLPQYRGMDVVEWPVLEHGRSTAELGLTVHFMDKGVDTGPVLMSKRIRFDDLNTFRQIRDRMEPQMVRMMVKAVKALQEKDVIPCAQELASGKQYFLMHPRLYQITESLLAETSSLPIGAN